MDFKEQSEGQQSKQVEKNYYNNFNKSKLIYMIKIFLNKTILILNF